MSQHPQNSANCQRKLLTLGFVPLSMERYGPFSSSNFCVLATVSVIPRLAKSLMFGFIFVIPLMISAVMYLLYNCSKIAMFTF